jgi:DNA polymerase theta
MESDRLGEIGIIVVDEIHLLGDPSRGYLLELLLTKIMYHSQKNKSQPPTTSLAASGDADAAPALSSIASSQQPSSSGSVPRTDVVQVVGMSATLPNVKVVADWLKAQLYVTDFRPVPLTQMLKVGPVVYNSDLRVVRTLDVVGLAVSYYFPFAFVYFSDSLSIFILAP